MDKEAETDNYDCCTLSSSFIMKSIPRTADLQKLMVYFFDFCS